MREARVKKENCVAHDLSRRMARHTEPSEGSGKHHRTGRPKRSLTLITLMNMPFWWRDVAGASLSAGSDLVGPTPTSLYQTIVRLLCTCDVAP